MHYIYNKKRKREKKTEGLEVANQERIETLGKEKTTNTWLY